MTPSAQRKSKRSPRRNPKRTIAIVTGSRAEFGLLLPVIKAIQSQPNLTPRILVTGTHLTNGTRRDIKAAHLEIHTRIPMQKRGSTGRAADVQALAKGTAGFGKAFDQLKPDIVLVLGDRIEVLAAASAASVGGQLIAHIHGGDRAEGVADEAIRHAISKLAHIHLAATAQSQRRLIRMGEPKHLTFNTGSPAADGLRDITPDPNPPKLIVLQHPIGDADSTEQQRMAATLKAAAPHNPMVLLPNDDPGSEGIRRAIRAANITHVQHLERRCWLQLLAGCSVIVGNSSAGLIEAAVLKTPAVNVGPRQSGREKHANVIDCDYGSANVADAIKKALKLDTRRMHHPYGNGTAGQQIAHLLATLPLRDIDPRKHNSY